MAACAVRIKAAWWLRWYLAGVYMAALTTGMRPDMDKVGAVMRRAVRIRMAASYATTS